MNNIVARYIKIPTEGFSPKTETNNNKEHLTLASAIKQTQNEEKNIADKRYQGDNMTPLANA